MLYLHSLPVQVWQRIAGAWTAYNFNASVVQDVSKYDGTRRVTFNFGTAADSQNYTPRINDILVPFADMTDQLGENGTFQFFGTRSNQPYYWEGVNDGWKTRPSILFLTAYNEYTIQFSDFFSLPEYGLATAGKHQLVTLAGEVGATVWNRLTAGHPFLKQTIPGNVIGTQFAAKGGSITYDSPTPVTLKDLCTSLVKTLGWENAGGTSYSEINGVAWLTWLGTTEQKSLSFDLRLEDVNQMEVRSRESSDAPNLMMWYTEAGQTGGVYYDEDGNFIHGIPASGSTWSLRTVYEQVDDNSNATTEAKAGEVLKSSPALDMVDISIVLDMTNRYSITYNTEMLASWSLPVPGSTAHVFGYLIDRDIILPVREYEFATGKLLLATNDDITLETGL